MKPRDPESMIRPSELILIFLFTFPYHFLCYKNKVENRDTQPYIIDEGRQLMNIQFLYIQITHILHMDIYIVEWMNN